MFTEGDSVRFRDGDVRSAWGNYVVVYTETLADDTLQLVIRHPVHCSHQVPVSECPWDYCYAHGASLLLCDCGRTCGPHTISVHEAVVEHVT